MNKDIAFMAVLLIGITLCLVAYSLGPPIYGELDLGNVAGGYGDSGDNAAGGTSANVESPEGSASQLGYL